MRIDVVMPPLGDAAGELVVRTWLKQVGDTVTKGEELFEVETDKTQVSVEALDSGTFVERVVQEGESAEPGDVIAVLDADGDERPS